MTVTDQSAPHTWTLTPDQYQATVEKIAAINTRAARRGFTGRLEIVGVRTVETVTRHPAPPRERGVYLTTLTGTPPAYAGWQLLAAVDVLNTDDGSHEFILRCAPVRERRQRRPDPAGAGPMRARNTCRPNRRHL